MKLAFLLATIGLALTLEAQAQPLGSLAQIAVIDRETGVALSPHYYRGEYWVAGPVANLDRVFRARARRSSNQALAERGKI